MIFSKTTGKCMISSTILSDVGSIVQHLIIVSHTSSGVPNLNFPGSSLSYEDVDAE
jgi:hypothetical protein